MQATRKRISNPAWLGLALVIGLPALAEAQLFPNRTLTRQREACASEPPFYSTIRKNYFGYYPTCWAKFPDGWNCPCPNPELPNRVAAFADRKRDPLPTAAPDGPEGEGMEGDDAGPLPDPRPGDDPGMPPVPNAGRSPFGTELAPPENTPKRNLPNTTPPQSSRTPVPPAVNPATGSTANPDPTLGLLQMPRISPPVASASAAGTIMNSGSLALAPDATLTSNVVAARPDLGPLPSTPMPGASTSIAPDLIADPSLLAGNQPATDGAPAQAPQRKGILSGLFGGSKRRR